MGRHLHGRRRAQAEHGRSRRRLIVLRSRAGCMALVGGGVKQALTGRHRLCRGVRCQRPIQIQWKARPRKTAGGHYTFTRWALLPRPRCSRRMRRGRSTADGKAGRVRRMKAAMASTRSPPVFHGLRRGRPTLPRLEGPRGRVVRARFRPSAETSSLARVLVCQDAENRIVTSKRKQGLSKSRRRCVCCTHLGVKDALPAGIRLRMRKRFWYVRRPGARATSEGTLSRQ